MLLYLDQIPGILHHYPIIRANRELVYVCAIKQIFCLNFVQGGLYELSSKTTKLANRLEFKGKGHEELRKSEWVSILHPPVIFRSMLSGANVELLCPKFVVYEFLCVVHNTLWSGLILLYLCRR